MVESRIGGSGYWVTAAGGGGSSRIPQPVQHPSIETGEVVVVGGASSGSCTFLGLLSAEGWPCGVYWSYRVSGGSWTSTDVVSVPGGGGLVSVSLDVVGLLLSTLYEVKASCYATSGPFSGQRFVGELVSFTVPGTTSNAPLSRTLPAQSVTGFGALLRGRVDALGTQTSVQFYLTNVLTGASLFVPDVALDAGAGSGFVVVSTLVDGLSELTNYQYVCFSTNTSGQVTGGGTISFVTLDDGGPPSLDDPIVSLITDSTASVSVVIRTNGLPCQVLVNYRSSVTTYVPKVVDVLDGELSVRVVLDGMLSSTLHYVSASISSAGGFYQSAPEVTFTTGVVALAPVGATGLPSGISNNYATLNSLFNPGGGLTMVTFEYAVNLSHLLSGLGTVVSASATSSAVVLTEFSALVPNLSLSTRYYYRSRAVNSGGSLLGNVVSFFTGGVSGVSVVSVTDLAATNVASLSVQMNGTVNAGGIPTAYHFEYWVVGLESTTTKYTDAVYYDPGV